MPRRARRRSRSAPSPTLRGEAAGEGPPIVLCHGITATRRYGPARLAGAGAGRARGRSPTTPAATASPTPPRRGRVMDTRSWSPTWSGSSPPRWGRGGSSLAGHSMGAHTAVAYALRAPRAARRPGRDRPGLHGRRSTAESLGVLGRAGGGARGGGIDGFVDYIDRDQGIDPAWRDSVLRFTRERMLPHRHPEALVAALREVPRSRPFELAGRARASSRCRRWSSPATTTPIPAIPTRPRPPTRRPAAGAADQRGGGRVAARLAGRQLSREIAAFYTKALSSSR